MLFWLEIIYKGGFKVERVLISALFFSIITFLIFLVKRSVIKNAGKIYLKGFSITGKKEKLSMLAGMFFLVLLCLVSVYLLDYSEFLIIVFLCGLFGILTPNNYYLGEKGLVVKTDNFYFIPLKVKFFHKAEIKEVKKEIKDNKIILGILIDIEKRKEKTERY